MACHPVYLTEADRCNTNIVICSGVYATLEEAQAVCPTSPPPPPPPPPPGNYRCDDNGNCVQDEAGEYSSYEDCAAACGEPGVNVGCCGEAGLTVTGTVTSSALDGDMNFTAPKIGAEHWYDPGATSGDITVGVSITCIETGVGTGQFQVYMQAVDEFNAPQGYFNGLTAGGGATFVSGTWYGGAFAGQPVTVTFTHPCP